ncbi:unnamed protein product [Amoebophrya sp. A120]|nr:unnamed protein product [Amoebophrya sp. A120]|eukprot:GSA120T00001377001.1
MGGEKNDHGAERPGPQSRRSSVFALPTRGADWAATRRLSIGKIITSPKLGVSLTNSPAGAASSGSSKKIIQKKKGDPIFGDFPRRPALLVPPSATTTRGTAPGPAAAPRALSPSSVLASGCSRSKISVELVLPPDGLLRAAATNAAHHRAKVDRVLAEGEALEGEHPPVAPLHLISEGEEDEEEGQHDEGKNGTSINSAVDKLFETLNKKTEVRAERRRQISQARRVSLVVDDGEIREKSLEATEVEKQKKIEERTGISYEYVTGLVDKLYRAKELREESEAEQRRHREARVGHEIGLPGSRRSSTSPSGGGSSLSRPPPELRRSPSESTSRRRAASSSKTIIPTSTTSSPGAKAEDTFAFVRSLSGREEVANKDETEGRREVLNDHYPSAAVEATTAADDRIIGTTTAESSAPSSVQKTSYQSRGASTSYTEQRHDAIRRHVEENMNTRELYAAASKVIHENEGAHKEDRRRNEEDFARLLEKNPRPSAPPPSNTPAQRDNGRGRRLSHKIRKSAITAGDDEKNKKSRASFRLSNKSDKHPVVHVSATGVDSRQGRFAEGERAVSEVEQPEQVVEGGAKNLGDAQPRRPPDHPNDTKNNRTRSTYADNKEVEIKSAQRVTKNPDQYGTDEHEDFLANAAMRVANNLYAAGAAPAGAIPEGEAVAYGATAHHFTSRALDFNKMFRQQQKPVATIFDPGYGAVKGTMMGNGAVYGGTQLAPPIRGQSIHLGADGKIQSVGPAATTSMHSHTVTPDGKAYNFRAEYDFAPTTSTNGRATSFQTISSDQVVHRGSMVMSSQYERDSAGLANTTFGGGYIQSRTSASIAPPGTYGAGGGMYNATRSQARPASGVVVPAIPNFSAAAASSQARLHSSRSQTPDFSQLSSSRSTQNTPASTSTRGRRTTMQLPSMQTTYPNIPDLASKSLYSAVARGTTGASTRGDGASRLTTQHIIQTTPLSTSSAGSSTSRSSRRGRSHRRRLHRLSDRGIADEDLSSDDSSRSSQITASSRSTSRPRSHRSGRASSRSPRLPSYRHTGTVRTGPNEVETRGEYVDDDGTPRYHHHRRRHHSSRRESQASRRPSVSPRGGQPGGYGTGMAAGPWIIAALPTASPFGGGGGVFPTFLNNPGFSVISAAQQTAALGPSGLGAALSGFSGGTGQVAAGLDASSRVLEGTARSPSNLGAATPVQAVPPMPPIDVEAILRSELRLALSGLARGVRSVDRTGPAGEQALSNGTVDPETLSARAAALGVDPSHSLTPGGLLPDLRSLTPERFQGLTGPPDEMVLSNILDTMNKASTTSPRAASGSRSPVGSGGRERPLSVKMFYEGDSKLDAVNRRVDRALRSCASALSDVYASRIGGDPWKWSYYNSRRGGGGAAWRRDPSLSPTGMLATPREAAGFLSAQQRTHAAATGSGVSAPLYRGSSRSPRAGNNAGRFTPPLAPFGEVIRTGGRTPPAVAGRVPLLPGRTTERGEDAFGNAANHTLVFPYQSHKYKISTPPPGMAADMVSNRHLELALANQAQARAAGGTSKDTVGPTMYSPRPFANGTDELWAWGPRRLGGDDSSKNQNGGTTGVGVDIMTATSRVRDVDPTSAPGTIRYLRQLHEGSMPRATQLSPAPHRPQTGGPPPPAGGSSAARLYFPDYSAVLPENPELKRRLQQNAATQRALDLDRHSILDLHRLPTDPGLLSGLQHKHKHRNDVRLARQFAELEAPNSGLSQAQNWEPQHVPLATIMPEDGFGMDSARRSEDVTRMRNSNYTYDRQNRNTVDEGDFDFV